MGLEGWYDGCCEPVNPGGHASYGVVMKRDGKTIWSASGYVGVGPLMSCNVAEYSGLCAAIDYLIAEGFASEPVVLHGDSKLSVEQIMGRWRVRGGLYLPYFHRAKALAGQCRSLDVRWVPREQNGEADVLSKAALRARGVVFRIQP